MINWITDTKPVQEGKYLVTIEAEFPDTRVAHIGYWDGEYWTGYVLSNWRVVAWAEMPGPYGGK